MVQRVGALRHTLRVNRAINNFVLLVILAAAVAISVNTFNDSRDVALNSFTERSRLTADSMTNRLNGYRDLLYSGRALLDSSQQVTMVEWNRFFRSQDTFRRYEGVSSISYIQNVSEADLPEFTALMRSPNYFGPGYTTNKLSSGPVHGLATVYSSDNDVSSAVGLDLFSDATRKPVYDKAAAQNTAIASPPYKLATGYQGFIVVLPRIINDNVDGFVLVSFRFDDVMRSLLPLNDGTLTYQVTDVSGGINQHIYTSKNWSNNNDVYTRQLDVGGRTWKLEIAEANDRHTGNYFVPGIIMTTAIVLVAALYVSLRREERQPE